MRVELLGCDADARGTNFFHSLTAARVVIIFFAFLCIRLSEVEVYPHSRIFIMKYDNRGAEVELIETF